ncbi:MAG: L-aspartate oxidase [Lachnospiraceae bacterium]|nr:L-aspartate oxidase [Lachnospiraceae bacterium]
MKTDILIVGSGCSGLYCALMLPRDKKITIITKADAESSDSFLAQGGICMLKDESDYDNYFEDTLKAGHYENDRESVEIMIRSSQDVIQDLIGYGADFARDEKGNLAFTREAAHSDKRILFHEDITGEEITSKLLAAVRRLSNVTIYENTKMLDIVTENNCCYGAVIRREDGTIETVQADYTVWACGGVGGLYRHSTNFRHLTGDALALSIRHGIRLKDVNYVQIHPTTFYSKDEEDRSFLISESVRGEGAKLYDKNMNRFVNELLPRDRLTEEIYKQMEKDQTEHVWEDLRPIPEEELKSHFPNIVEHCRQMGYDVTKECIPVVPAQHYFMGGVWVDHESHTSMERLYAVGETACNGVHGRNRLASNSLLESLVFAKRAAKQMERTYAKAESGFLFDGIDLSSYENQEELASRYHKYVRDAIMEAEQKMVQEPEMQGRQKAVVAFRKR